MPDLIPLDGRWQMVRAERGGESAPEMVVNRLEIEFGNDTYQVRFAGEVTDRGTYTAEPGTPPTLSLCGTRGPNAGKTIPCLYQLVGDRLRICYGLDGTLPQEFATAPGTEPYLATYRRQGF